jgi:tetratricopeptide (TPR) repeat protein
MSSVETFSDVFDLDVLTRGIEWASGIAFFFLVVDDPRLRERAIADIERRLKGRTVRRLSILRETKSLRAEIRALPKLDTRNLLVVTGIENVVRDENDTDVPLIHSLNVTRDALGRIVPCPILFVAPRFILRVLEAGAPDFFSTRSGVYVYAGRAEEQPWENETPALPAADVDLTDTEKIERIEELEELLAKLPDLRSRGADTTGIYLRTALRVVSLLIARYEFERVKTIAVEAYAVARATDAKMAIQFVDALATIARAQDDTVMLEQYATEAGNLSTQIDADEAKLAALEIRGYADEARGDVDSAVLHFEAALEVADKLGESAVAARLEADIADLLGGTGRGSEAIELYQRARQRAIAAGARPLSAFIGRRLASALFEAGQLLEAETVAEVSVREFERLQDLPSLSLALSKLGDILAAQERWEEAESAYRRSIDAARRSTVQWFALIPLFELLQITQRQGDHAAESQLIQEALTILEESQRDIPKDVETSFREALAELQSAP